MDGVGLSRQVLRETVIEVEGAQGSSPNPTKKLDYGKRDNLISIKDQSEKQQPGNILVCIIDCIKHFFCCCCFKGPPKSNPLNVLDDNSTTQVFRALQQAQNSAGALEDAAEVYRLIEAGSDLALSKEKSTGHSFFHLATQFPSLIDYLIKNGKMKEIDINSFLDNNGTTPLGYAILCSQETRDETLADSFLLSAKYLIEWKGCLDVSLRNGKCGSILHYVVEKRIEAIFPLNRKRDDLNSTLEMGISPLCYALYMNWIIGLSLSIESNFYLPIAQHLFEANAKILYTNDGIPLESQESFRQFVEKHGFGAALAINVGVED